MEWRVFRGDLYTRVLPIWTLLIGSFNHAGLRNSGSSAEPLEGVHVPAVAGGEAVLPCDAGSPPQSPDSLLLVVWYKDDNPVYSFDARVKGASAHWADESFGGRARWSSPPPSSLRIRDVKPSDRALYRCRVDFKISPTRNYKISLDVIELPEKPKVFDENDKEVLGVAGPYYEDHGLKLTCVVSGGKPMPRVRWWREDKVLETLPPLDDRTQLSVLELRVPKLTRDYLDAIYTCTADNTPLVPPLRSNVKLQLYLRPLSVEIMAREQPLSIGVEAELLCRAIGARPPAIITWWLDGKQLNVQDSQKESLDGNETISTLRWTPRMEHEGRVLTCKAKHITLEDSTLETTMSLNLHYVPIVVLQLGSKLNPNDIEEGDDVYFECVVRANPPAYKVVWEHNGQVMTHNQRAGVIAGSAHLALQGVSRHQGGMYACTASNVEGDGRSPPLHLQVIYKPVCKKNATIIVGAAIEEAAKVLCEVDAHPPPKNFQWMLNNSMVNKELDTANYTVENGRSILSYTPSSESDYGTLSCRATNLAGQQIEPCHYTILPAVRPDPPVNCTAHNLTDDSVELKCLAGYDGGLHTTYVAEAWSNGVVVSNASGVTPTWRLRELGAGRQLKILIYAYNARGRSESFTLKINTLTRLALHTEAKTGVRWEVGWALGGAAGTGGTLAAVACLALLAARQRRHRPLQYEGAHQNVKGYKGSLASANHSPLAQADDKNPDVVPLGKDFHPPHEMERMPEPPPYGAVVSGAAGARADSRTHTPHPPHTPITPGSDAQSIGTIGEDRRSIASGTLSKRREVVTTRTPLLANAHRESCV